MSIMYSSVVPESVSSASSSMRELSDLAEHFPEWPTSTTDPRQRYFSIGEFPCQTAHPPAAVPLSVEDSSKKDLRI